MGGAGPGEPVRLLSLNANPEMAGDAQFAAILRNLNITSARHLPSLSALRQLVADLEAISDQQVA